MSGKIAINWFDMPVTDLARARDFYEAVFQTDLQSMPGPDGEMFVFMNGEEPQGGLFFSEGNAPSQTGQLMYFAAQDDIDGMLVRVTVAGGSIVMPKTAIGEHGFIAHIVDTEGNKLALHSM